MVGVSPRVGVALLVMGLPSFSFLHEFVVALPQSPKREERRKGTAVRHRRRGREEGLGLAFLLGFVVALASSG